MDKRALFATSTYLATIAEYVDALRQLPDDESGRKVKLALEGVDIRQLELLASDLGRKSAEIVEGD